jgi:hypothetical protein
MVVARAARSSRSVSAAALARQKDLCLKLISVAKDSSTPWESRRFATLLAEHQILKLRADDLETFDAIFVALNLKQPGLERSITTAVLKEGYSTTELRGFISEFQRKLSRLNRVHRKLHMKKANDVCVRELRELSRRECKLTLARYLFTPEEIVERVLQQVRVSEGVKDLDVSQPRYLDAEIAHVLNRLPEYEASILRRLCESAKIYWVSDETSQAINSLVEYPLTTVVLVIKPREVILSLSSNGPDAAVTRSVLSLAVTEIECRRRIVSTVVACNGCCVTRRAREQNSARFIAWSMARKRRCRVTSRGTRCLPFLHVVVRRRRFAISPTREVLVRLGFPKCGAR